jgi:flagellar M-ring protein FliF
MLEMWSGLQRQARWGVAIGTLAIVLLVGGLALWAYRTDYQVLFSDLAPRDAAAMTAELDKSKTPYELSDGGATILVPKELVYKTRLALMGTDVPLHGAVGFELFNNADFGMTEFVQKVNYQRAVQGELTRTILAIEGVQSARVHLAVPEQGLFKKAATKPKASVTVSMKPGKVLAPEQVTGIQRLVAASVPDIQAADVTVLNQHGVALTRQDGAGALPGGADQLDAKRGAEDYLQRKIGQVLDRTFGPGETIASVDVLLNLDQSRVTTEEVLPSKPAASGEAPTGVVVRERHSMRDGDGGAVPAGTAPARNGGSTTSESDYQVGRRTEHLAVASGTVRRMTIAVVVRQALGEDQRERLRQVVALAAGYNEQRGDAIVVSSMGDLVNTVSAGQAVAAPQQDHAAPVEAQPVSAARPRMGVVEALIAVLALVAALAALGWWRYSRSRQPVIPALDAGARQRLLADVRSWIDQGAPAGNQVERP